MLIINKKRSKNWLFSEKIIEGDLPSRAEKLVIEWATLYQKELQQIWTSQEFRKLPPLK